MNSKSFTISIFGLGYVGTVTAACLAKNGNRVIGVDKDESKVNLIGLGQSPIVEPKINDLLNDAINAEILTSTSNVSEAIMNSDISIIAVGTPSRKNGSIDLKYVENVCKEIAGILKNKKKYHTVILRSTVLPETCEKILIPIIEKISNKKQEKDFGFIFNPEFLREGSAVDDFYFPPKTVIGCSSSKDAQLMKNLYNFTKAPLFITSYKVAEMVKYADNAFHATKVIFGNEIGALAKTIDVDSHEVMNIFCSDTKLNISSYYLKPGFAFGGSCLPKDLRALMNMARHKNISTPLISSLIPSNEEHIDRAFEMIINYNKKKIGFLGFAFKANTDDLRESPILNLMERLIGKGYDVRCYDDSVQLAKLVGSNKLQLKNKLPHISKLMVNSQDELVDESELIIIGNSNKEYLKSITKLNNDQVVVDLVRISEQINYEINYNGICW